MPAELRPDPRTTFRFGMRAAAGGSGRKVCEWLGLIPVSHRKEIVRAVVGVAMLHGVLEISRERHRIIGVPPVQAVSAARALRVDHERRSVIKMGERNGAITSAKIPGAIK